MLSEVGKEKGERERERKEREVKMREGGALDTGGTG